MTGVDMALLRRRVRRCGFTVCQYSYPSIRRDVAVNAAGLIRYLHKLEADTIHLVGHSLGGLVIRHCLHSLQDKPLGNRIGRVVTLGTPHQGSAVARQVARHTLLRYLLGNSITQGLDGDLPPWPAAFPLGVIIGTKQFGVGQLLGGYQGPGDGTVSVEEARIAAMRDCICLLVNHTGMQFFRSVAAQVCAFLHHGHFDHPD